MRYEDMVKTAVDLLANEPHDTIAGLKRRYYYRGKFILMEHLSPKALDWNVKRLKRREPEHAARLSEAWNAATDTRASKRPARGAGCCA